MSCSYESPDEKESKSPQEPNDVEDESDNLSESSDFKDESDNLSKSNGEPVCESVVKKSFDSHDVAEGKTVFLKNVPFNITNDELKECVQKIGPVCYAVQCIDPLTEHSRGTAFVKFKVRTVYLFITKLLQPPVSLF